MEFKHIFAIGTFSLVFLYSMLMFGGIALQNNLIAYSSLIPLAGILIIFILTETEQGDN